MLKRHPYIIRSVWRRTYEHVNPLFFPTLHVNEFPKSGGTWLCRMLSEVLDRRFDDNRYPKFGTAVMKHHRLSFGLTPTITVIRDPRDVVVSYFHHMLKSFSDDPFNKHGVRIMQNEIYDGQSAEPSNGDHLAIFIERLILSPVSPAFTWGEFYRHQAKHDNHILRYEDMRTDPLTNIGLVLRAVGADYSEARLQQVIDAHNIDKILAKRQQNGQQDGNFFIRKGKVGGWRESLREESIALIEKDAGDLLDRYGYR